MPYLESNQCDRRPIGPFAREGINPFRRFVERRRPGRAGAIRRHSSPDLARGDGAMADNQTPLESHAAIAMVPYPL